MIASIAHRVSGVTLFMFAPLYLWLLHGMTGSAEDFSAASQWLHSGLGRFILWLVGIALVYHFFNGIRFLALDAGRGESRHAMHATARLVIALAVLVAVVLGGLLL